MLVGVPIGADRNPRDVLIPQTRSKSWPFFGRGPASMPIYRLSLDQMTSILLLVNEAAMNAAKHVFRPREGGRFEVSLAEPASGQVRLVIRDDGPGLLGATGADGARSLGMTIMRAFAGQLGGNLQVLEGPGTGLQVDIPLRR